MTRDNAARDIEVMENASNTPVDIRSLSEVPRAAHLCFEDLGDNILDGTWAAELARVMSLSDKWMAQRDVIQGRAVVL